MARVSEIKRNTKETHIQLTLGLDGTGKAQIGTGIGFLDHMMAQFAVHGFFDLDLKAQGDTHVDYHHTVEDVGIALGMALNEALGDRSGIHRYGQAVVPMDEALALCAIDCSGRSHLSYDDTLEFGKVGTMDTELFREFFEAFVRTALVTMHIKVLSGRNAHHVIEAVFKAFTRALRMAVDFDPRREGVVPSTKGNL